MSSNLCEILQLLMISFETYNASDGYQDIGVKLIHPLIFIGGSKRKRGVEGRDLIRIFGFEKLLSLTLIIMRHFIIIAIRHIF